MFLYCFVCSYGRVRRHSTHSSTKSHDLMIYEMDSASINEIVMDLDELNETQVTLKDQQRSDDDMRESERLNSDWSRGTNVVALRHFPKRGRERRVGRVVEHG
jgi:hypothetical protein